MWAFVAALAVTAAGAVLWLSGQGDAAPAAEPPPAATTQTPDTRSAAPGEPAIEPMEASRPVRLRIPSLGVTSALMGLGLESDGTLEVPPGAYPAGWFTGAPTPGELGPAVIAGHVAYNGAAGVFIDLASLQAGAKVFVHRADDSIAVFEVSSVQFFAKDSFPSKAVYGDIDHPGLRLITCGGFDRATDTYEDNIVVFADLVHARR